MIQKNACATYDFTLSFDVCGDRELLVNWLNDYAKKWVFQLEDTRQPEVEGDKGYIHWQGKFSLIKKRRATEIPNPLKIHFSPTSKENLNEWHYVEKKDTRIDGPWHSWDEETYIPRQYRGLMDKLYPYQKEIVDSLDKFNDRKVNYIFCHKGNNGKSTIAALCELYKGAVDLPPCNDFKEIVQATCDEIYGRTRNPKGVFFDLPRSMDKSRLFGIYSAMEQIKKGKVFDLRYKYKKWWFDSPAVWVFSNMPPDLNQMSIDRWNLWIIDDEKKLCPLPLNDDSDEEE